mmetsp:Transcript_82738/g.252898  ORF Transcript_82738/g.252898 Transcript_82738/m.252898 type:complete len:229 (+) Transcript_82738:473-1159(+)
MLPDHRQAVVHHLLGEQGGLPADDQPVLDLVRRRVRLVQGDAEAGEHREDEVCERHDQRGGPHEEVPPVLLEVRLIDHRPRNKSAECPEARDDEGIHRSQIKTALVALLARDHSQHAHAGLEIQALHNGFAPLGALGAMVELLVRHRRVPHQEEHDRAEEDGQRERHGREALGHEEKRDGQQHGRQRQHRPAHRRGAARPGVGEHGAPAGHVGRRVEGVRQVEDDETH